MLQVKKQSDWIQPPTQKGIAKRPVLAFDNILNIAKSIPELEVEHWQDINKLDVRPGKGIIKVLGSNNWEAQIDAQSGAILQVAFRRSDTIEAIHDGSWFAEGAKLWLFLPAGIILFIMWLSGCVLLITTLKSKFRKRKVQNARKLS